MAIAEESKQLASPIEPRGEEPKWNLPVHLPSVKDILVENSVQTTPEFRGSTVQARVDDLDPTPACEPRGWSLGLWWAWPPVALFVLCLGIVGIMLAFTWAQDCSSTSIVSQRLLAGTDKSAREKPLPKSIRPPVPTWWGTTAAHLVTWGAYFGKSNLGDSQSNGSKRTT